MYHSHIGGVRFDFHIVFLVEEYSWIRVGLIYTYADAEKRDTERRLSAWKILTVQAAAAPDWELPKAKGFTPKYRLPLVEDYRAPAPPEFWEVFPSRSPGQGTSLISEAALRAVAAEAGRATWPELEAVCRDIREGADIGCVGEFREPSWSGNAPSAFEYGPQVTDSIASWVDKGFVFGPIDREHLPVGVKVNGIMCRPKPNGSARVILNLSAPRGKSVNEGIDKKCFPAVMSSTRKWVGMLNRAGHGAWIAKCDWAEAYKHLAVRPEDIKLQYFSWLGKFFAEVCLVFGAVSSAGLYDQVAKVVLILVILLSLFPADMVCQYLDDTCATAGANQRESLERFFNTYAAVASRVGVLMADTTDPDKAFAPCNRGVVLGVEYDTINWTWRIPQEKAARFMLQLRELIAADELRQDEIWRIVGRAMHFAPLIPAGRFNLDYLLRANKVSTERDFAVRISPELKRQAAFWILMIKVCSGTCGIPNLGMGFPAWTLEVFTDAAGGSLGGVGRGCGGVCGPCWFYVPWPRKINCGVKHNDGKKLSKKLSALELVGPLVAASCSELWGAGAPMRLWVDNAGSVRIWEKGYSSSCDLCSTLVKAIATVAAGLGCRFTVCKITRCSTKPAILADLLSKAAFQKFWALRGSGDRDPVRIPASILAWVAKPRRDDELGARILRELRGRRAAAQS